MQIAFWPPTFTGSMPVFTTALSQSCTNPPPPPPPNPRLRLLRLHHRISMRSGTNSTCCASSSSRDSPRISVFSMSLTSFSASSALRSDRMVLPPRRVPHPPNELDLELFLTNFREHIFYDAREKGSCVSRLP